MVEILMWNTRDGWEIRGVMQVIVHNGPGWLFYASPLFAYDLGIETGMQRLWSWVREYGQGLEVTYEVLT